LPRGVEPKCPGGLATKVVQILERVVEIAKRGADPFEQPLAGLGQCNATGGAVDQPQVEPALDVAERMAQRGSGNPEFGRGGAKAAMPGDRTEGSIRIAEIFSLAPRIFSGLSHL
jgi:hypothetical protein